MRKLLIVSFVSTLRDFSIHTEKCLLFNRQFFFIHPHSSYFVEFLSLWPQAIKTLEINVPRLVLLNAKRLALNKIKLSVNQSCTNGGKTVQVLTYISLIQVNRN